MGRGQYGSSGQRSCLGPMERETEAKVVVLVLIPSLHWLSDLGTDHLEETEVCTGHLSIEESIFPTILMWS